MIDKALFCTRSKSLLERLVNKYSSLLLFGCGNRFMRHLSLAKTNLHSLLNLICPSMISKIFSSIIIYSIAHVGWLEGGHHIHILWIWHETESLKCGICGETIMQSIRQNPCDLRTGKKAVFPFSFYVITKSMRALWLVKLTEKSRVFWVTSDIKAIDHNFLWFIGW